MATATSPAAKDDDEIWGWRLEGPLDCGLVESLKVAIRQKIEEVLHADMTDDVFQEYILTMLGNGKTIMDVRNAIGGLIAEDQAADFALWLGRYMQELGGGRSDHLEDDEYDQEDHNEAAASGVAVSSGDSGSQQGEGGEENAAEAMDVVTGRDTTASEEAAVRLFKTAIEQSVKSTAEAPRTVYKVPSTPQGPPPDWKPYLGRGKGRSARGGYGGGSRRGGGSHVSFTMTLADEEQLRGRLEAGGWWRGRRRYAEQNETLGHGGPPVMVLDAHTAYQQGYLPYGGAYVAYDYQHPAAEMVISGYGPIRGRGGGRAMALSHGRHMRMRPPLYHPYAPYYGRGGRRGGHMSLIRSNQKQQSAPDANLPEDQDHGEDHTVNVGGGANHMAANSRGRRLGGALRGGGRGGPRANLHFNPHTGRMTYNKVWVREKSNTVEVDAACGDSQALEGQETSTEDNEQQHPQGLTC